MSGGLRRVTAVSLIVPAVLVQAVLMLQLLVLVMADKTISFRRPPAGATLGVAAGGVTTGVVTATVTAAASVGVTEVAAPAFITEGATVFGCQAKANSPVSRVGWEPAGRRRATRTHPCPYRRSIRCRGARSDGAGWSCRGLPGTGFGGWVPVVARHPRRFSLRSVLVLALLAFPVFCSCFLLDRGRLQFQVSGGLEGRTRGGVDGGGATCGHIFRCQACTSISPG